MASTLDAVVLGVVEGLTEFLPVSSTGHLILTSRLLGIEHREADDLSIIVQFGAIMAVLVYYRDRVALLLRGLSGRDAEGLRLNKLLAVAFLPAAVLGALFGGKIQDVLFGPVTVAAALIVGGVAMIVAEYLSKRVENYPIDEFGRITMKDALCVGIAQCFALWPGMSRSMTTIVGAQLRGFSPRTAAEFSFLLALPTLGAATVFKFIKEYEALTQMDGMMQALLIGNIVSFIVAFVAVWTFIRLVSKVGMTPFGIYRIILGVIVLFLEAR